MQYDNNLIFDEFFDLVEDLAFVLDESGQILKANKKAIKTLQYSEQEIVKLNTFDIHPTDKRDEVMNIFSELLQGIRDNCPVPLQTRSGDLIPVKTKVKFTEYNGQRVIVTFCKDLSEITSSNTRFEVTFENNPTPTAILELESGVFLDVNSAFANKVGFTKDEIKYQKLDFVLKDFSTVLRQNISNELKKYGKIKKVKIDIKKKDNSKLTGFLSAELIETDGQNLILIIFEDISFEQKLLEDLKRNELKWKFALESTEHSVWEWDIEKNKLTFSPNWSRMLGYYHDELDEDIDIWERLVHPDDKQKCYYDMQQYLDRKVTAYNNTHRLRCKDGSYKWIYDTGKIVEWTESGKPKRMIGTHRDITKEKLYQTELKESEEKYRTMFDGSSDAYFVFDNNIVIDCNKAACELLLADKNDIIGKSPDEFSPEYQPNGRLSKEFAIENINFTYQNGYKNFEWVHRKFDGTDFWVEVYLTTLERQGKTYFFATWRDVNERKIAQLALQKSQEQLELVLNVTGEGIWDWNIPNETVSHNRRWCEILGLSNELINHHFSIFADSIFEDDKALVFERVNYAIQNNTPYFSEHRMVKTDGSIIWVRDRGAVVESDSEGNPVRMLGSIAEITEQKYAEVALQESNRRFKEVTEHSNTVTWEVDKSGLFNYVSEASEKVLGYKPEELINKLHFYDLHPENGRDEFKKDALKAFEKKLNFVDLTNPIVKKNGDLIWVSTNGIPILDDKGNLIAYRGNDTDITTRVLAENNLKISEEKFSKIGSSALDAVIMIDDEGKVQYWNPAAERIFGYSAEEVYGKIVHELIMPQQYKHKQAEGWKKYINTGEGNAIGKVIEIIALNANGKEFSAEIALSSMEIDGKFWAVAYIRDISDRKRYEQTILEEKERFLNILQGTNVGTWEWNVQTGETIFNERWAEIIGYTLEEISPVSIETWMKFAHPDDLKKSGEELEKHFNGELDYYSFESRMLHKNGDWVWVLDRGKVFSRTPDGKPLMMRGTHQDITNIKNAEIALQKELEKNNILLRNGGDGVHVIDMDTNLIFANDAFCSMLGYSQDEVIGMKVENWDNVFTQNELLDIVRGHFEKNVRVEFNTIHKCKDGSLIDVEISGAPVELDGKPLMFYSSRNITERKRIEKNLKQAMQILENVQIGFYLYHLEDTNDDRTLRMIFANPTSYEMTGHSPSDIIGKTLDEIFPALRDLNIPQRYAEVVRSGEARIFEDVYYSDEKRIDAAYSVKAFPLPNNHVGVAFENIAEKLIRQVEISESNERLKLAQEVGNIGSWEFDLITNKITWSEQTYRIYEVDPETFEVNFDNIINHFPQREDVLNALNKTINEKVDLEIEHEIITGKGNTRYVLEKGKIILSENDEPMKLIGSMADITERKIIEKELLHSNNLMKYIVENTQSAISIFDNNMNYIYVSNRYYKDLKVEIDNVIGLNHYDVFPNLPERIHEVHQRCLKGEVLSEESDILYYGENDMDWANWHCRPWHQADGSIGGIIVYLEIITERKKAEMKLEQSHILLKKLSEQLPGVIYQYRYHPDGRNYFPFSSENIYNVYAVTPDEVKEDASKVLQRLHPDDYDSVIAKIMKSYQTLELWEDDYRVILPEKGERWLRGVAKPEKLNDGSVLWHGYITDITKRKKASIEFKQTKELLELAINGTNDGIWDWNIITDELYLSPRWKEILGYKDEEISNNDLMAFYELLHPQDHDRVVKQLNDYLEGKIDKYDIEFRMFHKDGSVRWILAKAEALRDEQGKPYRMAGSHSDITDRKKYQEEIEDLLEKSRMTNELIEANLYQKNILVEELEQIKEELSNIISTKDKFFSIIAHDLRSPFNGFLGLTKLISEQLKEMSINEIQEFIDTLRDTAQNFYELLENLLSWASLQRGTLEINKERSSLLNNLEHIIKSQQSNLLVKSHYCPIKKI